MEYSGANKFYSCIVRIAVTGSYFILGIFNRIHYVFRRCLLIHISGQSLHAVHLRRDNLNQGVRGILLLQLAPTQCEDIVSGVSGLNLLTLDKNKSQTDHCALLLH